MVGFGVELGELDGIGIGTLVGCPDGIAEKPRLGLEVG